MNNQNQTNMKKEELIEMFNKSVEKEAAEYSRMHEAFLNHHDFNANPSHMAKTVTAWARKEILLHTWNQFVACEEACAEFMGMQPKGEGWRELAAMRRIDQVEMFRHYFNAALDAMLEDMQEDETNSKEQI